MNSKNQKYIVEITKKLESFKNAKEWSDFISLLASLDSTIKSYALPYIPRKELLSKRLEQCLNPLLPAGVHNKALETFSIIFETISREELEDNFGIYTLGLFTFASHSRLLVINHYLDVIEKHIIPFGSSIEIYSSNVILGLLPPLESRSNEFYNRAFLILNSFKSNVSEPAFYMAMWDLFLSNSNVRLPIVNYLLDTPVDVGAMAQDKALVTRALCKGLASKEALVLRGTLDVISSMFPLSTKDLKNNFKYDLLEGMLRIFLRRDLSLNKRVFGWMGYQNNTDSQNIRLLKNTLVRFLNNEKDLLVFFKIFITLSSKSRLSEQILESLLFKVLLQIKKYSQLNAVGNGDQDVTKEVLDIQSFSKSFLVEDLDVLWKIFYLKLKSSFGKVAEKEKNIVSMASNLDGILPEEQIIPKEVEDSDDEVDSLLEELLARDDLLNESQLLKESVVIQLYSEVSALFEENNLSYQADKDFIGEALSGEDTDDSVLEMSSSELLYYIDFCCENFNVFDDNVLSTHLPICILLVLKNRDRFEKTVLLDFLKNNVKRIKLEDQGTNVDPDIFGKIDKFYREEDVNTLQDIRGGFCKSLIISLQEFFIDDIENTHSFFIDFVLNHREQFVFDSYVKKYYDLMLDSSLRTIGNSLRLFNHFGVDYVKCEKLFSELWERFCRENIVAKPDIPIYNDAKWDLSLISELPSVSNVQAGFYRSATNLTETIYANRIQKPSVGDREEAEKYDYEMKAMDKKYIVILTYDYNILFKQKFEKYLLRKISEENKHNICLFIHYLFELEGNTEYYFYNLFFIINNKISGQDPVITALIKSLVNFEDAFMFLIKKFETSGVLSRNFIYIDDPNLNQIKGLVQCLKNMITYSRRFRVMLKTSEMLYKSNFFDGGKELNGRTIVYKILKYVFLCELEKIDDNRDDFNTQMSNLEVKNKVKSQQCADVLDEDLPALVSLLQRYRLDPAIILPSSTLIRTAGKQNYLLDFSTILDSQCFYYYDFLEFLFQLPINQKKLILCSILSNLGKDNYALMIKYEIIKEIIGVEDSAMNWSKIVQDIIRDSISFYDEDMSPIYISENVSERRSSAEILFNNSVNQSFTIKNNHKYNMLNSHTMDIKVRAVIKTAALVYSKLSGYFIEHLVSLPFPKKFVKDLGFKTNLFSNILSSRASSYEKNYVFLLEFYNV